METLYNNLKKCMLFKETDIKIISSIDKFIKHYKKNEIIALEEQQCNTMGIILNGKVEVKKILASGNNLILSILESGDIFGEVIIFSNINVYPATISAIEDSRVLFLDKKTIIDLCHSNKKFLENFIGILSMKIMKLNSKVTDLTHQSIRKKITNFILKEYKKQNALKIKLDMSKKILAEQLGIPRPSLSRELIKMKEEELIDYDRNNIYIKDIYKLEEILF